jgi:hypothetical protein
MEGFEMSRYLAALAGAAAIVALALLLPSSVNAGSSASAPSKYKPNQVSQQQAKQNFPITEYSSASRNSSRKH